ncbi:MAG: FtsX-like permease family protein, partial [Rhodobacteraceae bacterium]|nr:FtsX-like permease family protein [Paracoccaceae bacterium]
SEPDNAGAGFALGPRTIVRTADLAESGLLGPGTLFETEYRMILPPDTGLDNLRRDAEERFLRKGVRWQDSRQASPGTMEIINRVSAFLIIVGLGGLVVGGIGIALAMGKYIEDKTATVATLKVLGASQLMIFAVYMLQSLLLLLAGILCGLVLGLSVPMVFQHIIAERIDLPLVIGIYPEPLVEATVYGLMIGIVFTIWALSRTADVKPSALYRSAVQPPSVLPRWPYLAVIVICVGVFLVTAALFSGTTLLTLYFALGTATTLAILYLMARLAHFLARRSSGTRLLLARPALRLALGVIGGPGSGTIPMILALGLGFTILATVGQVSTNLVNRISGDLPAIAPEYFIVDIQNTQHDAFRDLIIAIPGVTRVESSPMLRGIISHINGERATDVAGEHWVLRGDRGITYSDTPPDGTVITEGQWWPAAYQGTTQVSFAAQEGEELGLVLGDRLTIN